MQKRTFLLGGFAAAVAAASGSLSAMGLSSPTAVAGFPSLYGPLGEVMVNPYKIAPLTAVIKEQ